MGYGTMPGQPGGYGGPVYRGPGGYGAPGYDRPGYGGPPPNDYLVWAILATMFCFMPLGVVSLVFAAQVSSKWNAGDVEGAIDFSRKAKIWAIASACAGAAITIIVLLLILASLAAQQST
jgi:hypothetical protein